MRRNLENLQNTMRCLNNYSLPLVSNEQHPSHGDDVMELHIGAYDRKFSVLYAKVSNRKHKKWEGDGILFCKDRTAVLQTEDGAYIARSSSFTKKGLNELCEGSRLVVGGFEVEVQEDPMLAEPLPSQSGGQLENEYVPSPPRKKFASVDRQFVQPFPERDQKSKDVVFVVNEAEVKKGLPAIFLDSRIACRLRPHQEKGIHFLFEKLKDPGGGAILADEMGLGKSVQTISLIISLIKRNSKIRGSREKYLLIVPSSLLGNWQCEFMKWVPHSRSLLFQITKGTEFQSYLRSIRCSPIAIMSYEMAVYIEESLTKVEFALIVCDEAHRLKNLNSRMHRLVASLQTERRLLLTGTPIQNDSDELFALLNLARPGAFGTIGHFRKLLEGSSDKEVSFRDLLNDTLLRRTAEVNEQFLPQKYEYIIFCRLSELQQLIYDRIRDFMTPDHLTLIDMLKKLCNHPSILYQSVISKIERSSECSVLYSKVLDTFPSSFGKKPLSVSDSGKLSVFVELMCSIRECNEKAVIVSNFTRTLDMLEMLCSCLYFKIYRLDGSVLQQKRMRIVKEFNSSSENNSVFLLSTKAGGVGLNLVGASRLILFDSDWNPAVDAQAMARIWRDGQTKPCHIYRLVTTGTIDEKILQRQVMKTGLSTILDLDEIAESIKTEFSTEDLYDIFSCDTKTLCNTHDLMECDCQGCGLLTVERDDIIQDELEDNRPSSVKVEDEREVTRHKENFLFRTEAPNKQDVIQPDNFLPNEVGKDGIAETSQSYSDISECTDKGNYFVATDLKEETKSTICDKKCVSPSDSLAALLQWRHYSQEYTKQFQLLKAQAGLSNFKLDDVTFVMKIVRNY